MQVGEELEAQVVRHGWGLRGKTGWEVGGAGVWCMVEMLRSSCRVFECFDMGEQEICSCDVLRQVIDETTVW